MKKSSITLLSVILTLSGCTTVADMVGMDSKTLNAQAGSNYHQILSKAQIDTTSNTAKTIQRAFNRLRPHANSLNNTGMRFDWQMTVIKDPKENAWAMPGGKMAFYTGLAQNYHLTESEIAAIVGHEMAHALLEHSKKQMGAGVLSDLTVQLGAIAVQTRTGYDHDLINFGASMLHEYGFDKPYSRHHEYEADALGMQLMAMAGYNPVDAINVWKKMNAKQDGGSKAGGILSTHPSNNSRIQAMEKLLPKNRAIYERAIRR